VRATAQTVWRLTSNHASQSHVANYGLLADV